MKIVLSSASHHAMLFAYIAKEVVETFGEEGEQAILHAVHRYGYERGQRMAMRARQDGNPCDAVHYDLYKEWECFPGQVKCTEERKKGSFGIYYSRCPWYTEWEHFGMLEYGRYYCGHVDEALLEGFGIKNGKLEKSRLYGAETCELRFVGRDCNFDAYSVLEQQRQALKNRAKMPWSYHVGHLYRCLQKSVEDCFGTRGCRVLKRAMKNYKAHFGTDALKLVYDYAQLNYTSLPEYCGLKQDRDKYQGVKKVFVTDVLVAGGSGAGITAAVEAQSRGQKVLLVSKGAVGNSGNLIMAGGGFSIDGWSARHLLHMEKADDSLDKKWLFDCIVKEGFYLNDQDLVKLYVEEGPEAVRGFLSWAEQTGQKFHFLKNGTWIASGKSFAKALKGGMEEQPDIQVMEDSVLLEVFTEKQTVTGALVLQIYTGELILVQAKAIVLATGGYQPFQFHNTVSDMTGDGQAIAYRAGARLVDMEFVMGMPTALEPEEIKGSIYPFVFEFNMPTLRYRMLDRNFQVIKLPEQARQFQGKKISKLANTYCFAKAKSMGKLTNRNGLYLDYSENTAENKRENLEKFYERFSAWHRKGYYNGESLKDVSSAIMENKPLEIGIGYEYSMGGIEVDSNMATCVFGLFAAGEVTGGNFGAFRAGDGIVEMLCQGHRAGKSAAKYCEKAVQRAIDKEKLELALAHHQRYFERGSGISARSLMEQIQRTCQECFGLLRDEEGLTKGLDTLHQLQLQLEYMCCVQEKERTYNMEWLYAIQCENLLICCEAGVRAALERKESRGCHMRSDYPQVNHDRYLKKYVFWNDNGKMIMTERKPRNEFLPFPTGKKASVLEYLIDPELHYRR